MSSQKAGNLKKRQQRAIVHLARVIRLDKKLSNFVLGDGKLKYLLFPAWPPF